MGKFILSLALLITSDLALAACQDLNPEQMWLWPQAYTSLRSTVSKKSVIVLQAKNQDDPERFTTMGPAPFPWSVKSLTLAYRLKKLPSPQALQKDYLERKRKWNAHGIEVLGLQLDYDSPTGKLENYVTHLRGLKDLLPRDQISITGLPDWLNRSEVLASSLKELRIPVYFQFYQGLKPAENADILMQSLAAYQAPFAVGLLPKQNVTAPTLIILKGNSFYKGLSCFYGSGS